ncbi:MAG TPA: 2,5-diamino-6-(ribosylamino)-4(3H)-pyrimidinone 5'-phosphate reductase [Methanoregula sp.]|nr:2,5-diamino-6-(ribosylamino)-4(3H)-pyrimidinone 5'-phosphate reductase [Methanoregula sp.]
MRPHVIVNTAISADGKLSTKERRQVKISGVQDFNRVDRLKAGCDAVMVGIGTVLADDPSLTVKGEECRKNRAGRGVDVHPVRIVVDSHARTPVTAKVLHKESGKRIIAVSHQADAKKVAGLEKFATVIVAGNEQVDLKELMEELGRQGIRRVLVEGGGTLIAGLVTAGLVDEIYTFIGNILIGGKEAPTLADGPGYISESEFCRLTLLEARKIEQGVLLHWSVER